MALAVGTAGFAIAWLATPHGRDITSAWQLVVKVFAFACLAIAIAFFPLGSHRWLHVLLYLPFVFFTGYLLPRISWFYYGDVDRAQDGSFYTHMYLLLYPGIVLTVTAAFRLGGGSPGRCVKVLLTGVVLVFSGFLDIMWFVVNPVDLPAQIDAPHINLITGGPISFGAAIVFALVHVPIMVGLNLLPLDRWFGRLLGTDAAAVEKPADAVEKPADAVEKPADAVEKPADAVEKPADEAAATVGDGFVAKAARVDEPVPGARDGVTQQV